MRRGAGREMPFGGDEQKELRNYLLGRVGEDQRQSIEQRFLTDDDFLEELEIVEEELIEEYLEATPQERQPFEQHFLNSPERVAKLRFAEALARAPAPAPEQTTWFEKLRLALNSQNWLLRTATASALVLVVVGLMWVARSPSPRTFATLTLTISTSERSQGGEATKLQLPIQGDTLRLQLRLPEGVARASRYRVDLRRENGVSQRLNPVEQNEQTVVVEIPANQITRGQYALNLYAIKSDGSEERIKGSFFLTVD